MIHHPFAAGALAVVFAFVVVVAALKGPLKSYVPDCSEISFGFCYERNAPRTE
jgi:hypothetical protein